MTTKAEELADQLTQSGALRWDTDRDGIVRLIESYGRLVQEAAAVAAESAEGETRTASIAIREMPLP